MLDRLSALRAGLTQLRDGRFADAARAVAPLVAADPDDVEGLLVRGLARGALGQAAAAAADLLRLAGLRPDAAHPLLDLVSLLRPYNRIADAAPVLAAALAQAPDDRRLAFTAAQVWLDLGESAAALGLLDSLLAADDGPLRRRALVLRGIVRCEANAFSDAIEDFRAALALDPEDASALTNLGIALGVLHRFDEALGCLDAACRLAPDDVRLALNRAVTLLKAGRWDVGFAAFEAARVRMPGHAPLQPRPFVFSYTSPPPPRLAPGDPVDGRTLLITHDEGFGDTIQYLRFVPLLARRGARVLVLVPPELARLAAGVEGVSGVLTDLAQLPPFDAHAPFPRLPLLFGVTLASLPAGRYIAPDAALVAAWAGRLPNRGPGRRRRIGLVWSGRARFSEASNLAIDRHRSLPLAALAPFADLADTLLVSLQKDRPAGEAPPPGLRLFDPMAAVTDFADSAAIIANLDAVVSADTAVVHLAGAMGAPVLMLDRFDHCWRWAAGDGGRPPGDAGFCGSGWYESLRIVRQERAGDWSGAVIRACAALSNVNLALT